MVSSTVVSRPTRTHSPEVTTTTPFTPTADETMSGATNSPSFFPPSSPPSLFDSFTEFAHAADPHHGEYVSYKTRRKNYRIEKKKMTNELISASQDPTILLMSDWIKVRTTLKQWNKYYVELRPGQLYLFKNQKTNKSSNWIGTIMLKMCELIERPSKKNGFCFKLFHPLEHPIWSPKGPQGEAFTSIMFPLPASYIIFRAPSEESGHKWMTAIELSLKCSNVVHKHRDSVTPGTPHSLSNMGISLGVGGPVGGIGGGAHIPNLSTMASIDKSDDELDRGTNGNNSRHKRIYNDSEIEKHFDLLDDGHTDQGESQDHLSTEESDDSCLDFGFNKQTSSDAVNGSESFDSGEVVETNYVFDGGNEEFGLAGDAGQTEDVPEENKSLLWALLKQCRPGMDLSKVVLPTFILEPRSFLEKLTDYYYHCDILSKASIEDDPLIRMKLVLKWYLSGFYKKPKGLKKPYNPILGETFRCYWQHSDTDSKTFYIAEQVSHHPPVSAFYVTNRKDGYCISGSILTKSKFYGNSISAVLEGTAKLTLLSRGEDYLITFPYAHCKGIFLGPMAFELGGKVMITCEKTGYKTDLEFKLKPFFGNEDQSNVVSGKLKLGNETLGIIDGHWDQKISYKDKRKGEQELFWSGIDPAVKSSRLKRFVVPENEQTDTESQKLWSHVSAAIHAQDQEAATVEKTKLEEAQREGAKQRAIKMEQWTSNHFVQDPVSLEWLYKLAEDRPWDYRADIKQYEQNFVVRTLTKNSTLNKKIPSFLTKKCSIEQIAKVDDVDRLLYRRAPPNSKHHRSDKDEALSESLKGIQKQLNTIENTLSTVERDQRQLRQELNHIHSILNRQNSSMSILSVNTGKPRPFYHSILYRFACLFKLIPAEIRQVMVVLIAHVAFYYISSFILKTSKVPITAPVDATLPSTTTTTSESTSALPTLDR